VYVCGCVLVVPRCVCVWVCASGTASPRDSSTEHQSPSFSFFVGVCFVGHFFVGLFSVVPYLVGLICLSLV